MKKKERLRTYHIKNRLLAVLLTGALLPTLLLTLVQAVQLSGQKTLLLDYQAEQTNILADRIQEYVAKHTNSVESVAAYINTSSQAVSAEKLQLFLQSVLNRESGFLNLYVADRNAKAVAFVPEVNPSGQSLLNYDFHDRDYFKEVSKNHATYISNIFMGRGGANQPIITIVSPLYDAQGKFNGYVLGTLDLQRLNSYLLDIGIRNTGEPVLLDAAGNAIYSLNTNIKTTIRDMSGNAIFRDATQSLQGSGVYVNSNANHKEWVTFHNIDGLHWTFWVSKSMEAINKPYRDALAQTAAIVFAIVIVLLFLGNHWNNLIQRRVASRRSLGNGAVVSEVFESSGAELDERAWKLIRKNKELEMVNRLITPILPNTTVSKLIRSSLDELQTLIDTEVRFFVKLDEGSVPVSYLEEWQATDTGPVGIQSIFFRIPLSVGNHLLGSLFIAIPEGAGLTHQDQRFVQTFAHSLAVLLQNDVILSEMQSKHTFLHTVLQSMSDAIVLTDINGRVVYANPRIEEIFGLSERELLGLPQEQMLKAVFSKIEKELEEQGGKTAGLRRFLLQMDTGEERICLFTSFPAAGENGTEYGKVFLWREITKEHEIDRLKNDLISLASHEFKTPITSIRGSIETLLRTDVQWDEEFKQELLVGVHEDIERIQSLVDDWLDISKIDSGSLRIHPAPLHIESIIESARHRLKPMERHNVEIDVAIPSGLSLIFADKARMEQVILNLLINAMRYNVETNPRIRITARQDSEFVYVRIADNGIGINPKHLDTIFDRFYRVDSTSTRSTAGTGLGLSISKGIIEAHGGRIKAESQVGEGSEFTVSIPRYLQ
ncbi:ATP-binding protein [Paenibacillus sp.]|uniref:sensor histidine kinase n=1 Tax=Paenibacillus sp. TaxID=58172 RepID=UPI0028AD2382|nr:ATP-binding protein [Paenibacillus sp.]